MARLCGRAVSTVDSWKARGSIPSWHVRPILDAAEQHEIPLSAESFIPENETDAA